MLKIYQNLILTVPRLKIDQKRPPNWPPNGSQMVPRHPPNGPACPPKAFLAQWDSNFSQIAPTWLPHAPQTPILGKFDPKMPKIAALNAPKRAHNIKKSRCFCVFLSLPLLLLLSELFVSVVASVAFRCLWQYRCGGKQVAQLLW